MPLNQYQQNYFNSPGVSSSGRDPRAPFAPGPSSVFPMGLEMQDLANIQGGGFTHMGRVQNFDPNNPNPANIPYGGAPAGSAGGGIHAIGAIPTPVVPPASLTGGATSGIARVPGTGDTRIAPAAPIGPGSYGTDLSAGIPGLGPQPIGGGPLPIAGTSAPVGTPTPSMPVTPPLNTPSQTDYLQQILASLGGAGGQMAQGLFGQGGAYSPWGGGQAQGSDPTGAYVAQSAGW